MPRNIELIAYWQAGPRDKFGNPTWTGPITVKGRWEDIAERFVNTDGATDTSRARVYIDDRVNVGDYIYRGKSTASIPPDEAHEIKQFFEVRNVQGTKRERKVIL